MNKPAKNKASQFKKVKILYLIPTLSAGGAEFLLAQIAAGLDQAEFIINIGCLKRKGPARRLIPAGIKVSVVCSDKKLTWRDFIKIYHFIKKQQPDIVHTHLWGADVMGILAARLAGIKNIISTEHNLNYDENWLKKISKIFVFRLAQKIVAVSQSVKKYCQCQLRLNPQKITVIYNGVDVKKFYFSRPKMPRPNQPLIIGAAGRLVKQKGFAVLIKALPFLENYDLQVKIAGSGPLANELENLTEKLGLTNKIKFIGTVSDMPSFYKGLDVFVLPSLWEGFGLVILEAGLAQLPVVASRIDGIKELIKDGRDGLLFTAGQPQALARQLEFLFNNWQLAYQLGLNLQKKVKNNFSQRQMVGQYAALYNSLKKG